VQEAADFVSKGLVNVLH